MEEGYHDRDRVATEQSLKAYSDRLPRAALRVSTIVGLVVSIASVATPRRLPSEDIFFGQALALMIDPTIWIFILLQYSSLPSGRRRQDLALKFGRVVFGLILSLCFTSSLAYRHGPSTIEAFSSHEPRQIAQGVLYLVQFICGTVTSTAFASFPRRPDVYHKESLVDQQYTLSLLSMITFSWNRGVSFVANQRPIELKDIPALDYRTRSHTLHTRLPFVKELPLWRQLLKEHGRQLVLQWGYTLLSACLPPVSQLAMYSFLDGIETGQRSGVAVWVLGLLASQLVQVATVNWLSWITTTRLEIPVGSWLQSLVFNKALRQYESVSPGQKKKKSDKVAGVKKVKQSVMNHMKVDSERIAKFCESANDPIEATVKLAVAGVFLANLLGWTPILSGLSAASLIVAVNACISRQYRAQVAAVNKYRDKKAHILTEALRGARQIRYCALEKHFEDRILAIREKELARLWRLAAFQRLGDFTADLGPLLLSTVAFLVYVVQNGRHIKASVIFASLGLFDHVQDAVSLLPKLWTGALEAKASFDRLERYLGQADRKLVSVPAERITLEDVVVEWPHAFEDDEIAGQGRFKLQGINVEFPTGELSVIAGRTGSGKSLLLAAILSEAILVSGTIHFPASDGNTNPPPSSETWVIPYETAFVSQSPWIESGTIRDNILFGLPLVNQRYTAVLDACALDRDILLFQDGDQTEVGPNGVSLSGGQRWRIALARALYSRAGVLVLDDVLSAVDAHVSRTIVYGALTGALAKGRTRILATHRVDVVLPFARYLVQLEGGRAVAGPVSVEEMDSEPMLGMESGGQGRDQNQEDAPQLERAEPDTFENERVTALEAEKSPVGRVKWSVYRAYYHASGGLFALASVLVLLVSGQALWVARTWSLKQLSQHAAAVLGGHLAGDEDGIFRWMGVYAGIYFLNSLARAAGVLAMFLIGQRAGRMLFRQMTNAVLRAPMAWMDTVEAGRVLNRFTSDMQKIDKSLPNQTFSFLQNLTDGVIIMATSLSVSPYAAVFGTIVLAMFVGIARQYVSLAREVKRINSISHSPIYDQFSSVLSGLSTIRAFGRTSFYMDRMYDLIDNAAKTSWALELSTHWMAFRMGLLGAIFVAAVAAIVAASDVDAAVAGFSLSFALRYTASLTKVLKSAASVELAFNACERVVEFTEIETEPDGGVDAPAGWPSAGRIEVRNLTVAYSEKLEPVLRDVTFTIEPGQRVGIVGRTGAGKSTLASVLFRLLMPRDGTISIDGMDISDVKLAHLRSRLAIIPQDPFLFSGTLRSNLDQDEELDDSEILAALNRVHLIELQESSLPDHTPGTELSPVLKSDAEHAEAHRPERRESFANLSMHISAGGTNLSQGQRQLVCLARAILKRPKVLILDEATSAVDRSTDAAIQESLREEFGAIGSTVLVIAHRLSTIADFDCVLVLDRGQVVEMGSPKELLEQGMRRHHENEASFWGLVQKSEDRDVLMSMILG
ncbi:P-loop containing nucleoside triphosphate hydrolase protein [Echria macrotheca]|uniref:P-loop containing nucleoside triphosphate hydrolase protein n=1 Tax=Echria macrotheca TaxID=438768 RepID=A0AAJ0F730_9PEZI|nr:P-loop containing nucleoside triphosphate hydrolase protein [Echria macrotheca]